MNQLAFFERSVAQASKPVAKIRYIGSKARIAKNILDLVGEPTPDSGVFIDAFSGTGTVSREAALRGWKVLANDHLLSSATLTAARLLCAKDVPFHSLGGYEGALNELNKADPAQGFIYREYTPSGLSRTGQERRYFTPENGSRIDGVRLLIEKWHEASLITRHEKTLLIADLLSAANSVANIAGTYGCFLRHWDNNALRKVELTPRSLLPFKCDFEVTNVDVYDVPSTPDDVVYLDPPYTKRQYAAYYHILETIAFGDEPEVEGVTGLRPWKEKLSPFCYKTKALKALDKLLGGIDARRVILSYSSEGHIAWEQLQGVIRKYGESKTLHIDNVGRYRPNQRASSTKSSVTEYLIQLDKSTATREVS